MRTVTVYSSLGDKVYEGVEAVVWGDLSSLISNDYGSLSDLKVFDKDTKVEYSTREARLPEGDFTIFIYQSKNKSGAVSYNEMRNRIKSIKAAFGQEAVNHFGNYTILNYDALRILLEAWDKAHQPKKKKNTVAEVTKTVTLVDIANALCTKLGYSATTILNILNKEFGVVDDSAKEEYKRFKERV